MNYEKIYNDFIEDRRTTEDALIASGEYFERHHVVPRSMGGTDDASNMIALTAGDHYFAHLCLAKAYGGSQWLGVWATSGMDKDNRRKIDLFSLRAMVNFARINMAQHLSDTQKGVAKPHMAGEKNPMNTSEYREKQLAAVRSEQYRKKMSAISRRTQNDPEVQKKRIANTDFAKTAESMKKLWADPCYAKRMSEAHIGQKAWNKGKGRSIVNVTTSTTYANIRDAEAKIGITYNAIYKNLSGRTESAGGYRWAYAD